MTLAFRLSHQYIGKAKPVMNNRFLPTLSHGDLNSRPIADPHPSVDAFPDSSAQRGQSLSSTNPVSRMTNDRVGNDLQSRCQCQWSFSRSPVGLRRYSTKEILPTEAHRTRVTYGSHQLRSKPGLARVSAFPFISLRRDDSFSSYNCHDRVKGRKSWLLPLVPRGASKRTKRER